MKAAQGREREKKKRKHSKRECRRANNTYVSKLLWQRPGLNSVGTVPTKHRAGMRIT